MYASTSKFGSSFLAVHYDLASFLNSVAEGHCNRMAHAHRLEARPRLDAVLARVRELCVRSCPVSPR